MRLLKKIRERARERREEKQRRNQDIERAQRLNFARLQMHLLDHRLACAVKLGKEKWARRIMPELQAAETKYRWLLAQEAAEVANLLDKFGGSDNG
jgi:hypothetical protein